MKKPQAVVNVRQFVELASGHEFDTGCPSFLLLDGARLPGMSAWLQQQSATDWISLLGASLGAPLMDVSPVLIRLSYETDDAFVMRALTRPAMQRAASVLVSTRSLRQLADHLIDHIYIDDPDGTRWGLAFWDPFILASLVGCQPTVNALVPGPLLTPEQSASLLAPISCCSFQHRNGSPCALRLDPNSGSIADTPFMLDQTQMDQLTDLPLPDQVRNVLKDALPELASYDNDAWLHQTCCNAIRQCREQGKDDLAAYCEAASDALKLDKPTQENLE